MSAKIEFTAKIITDDGSKEIAFTSEKPIPGFEDFEALGFSEAFDALESAVLQARKETSESVIAEYLSDNSKKTAVESVRVAGAAKINITPVDYSIESEVGTITAVSHRLVMDGKTVSNTAESFFVKTGPR
jgi:hypothetical protein